jgi:hypothetical protein
VANCYGLSAHDFFSVSRRVPRRLTCFVSAPLSGQRESDTSDWNKCLTVRLSRIAEDPRGCRLREGWVPRCPLWAGGYQLAVRWTLGSKGSISSRIYISAWPAGSRSIRTRPRGHTCDRTRFTIDVTAVLRIHVPGLATFPWTSPVSYVVPG